MGRFTHFLDRIFGFTPAVKHAQAAHELRKSLPVTPKLVTGDASVSGEPKPTQSAPANFVGQGHAPPRPKPVLVKPTPKATVDASVEAFRSDAIVRQAVVQGELSGSHAKLASKVNPDYSDFNSPQEQSVANLKLAGDTKSINMIGYNATVLGTPQSGHAPHGLGVQSGGAAGSNSHNQVGALSSLDRQPQSAPAAEIAVPPKPVIQTLTKARDVKHPEGPGGKQRTTTNALKPGALPKRG